LKRKWKTFSRICPTPDVSDKMKNFRNFFWKKISSGSPLFILRVCWTPWFQTWLSEDLSDKYFIRNWESCEFVLMDKKSRRWNFEHFCCFKLIVQMTEFLHLLRDEVVRSNNVLSKFIFFVWITFVRNELIFYILSKKSSFKKNAYFRKEFERKITFINVQKFSFV
jgi:hypothetical protein